MFLAGFIPKIYCKPYEGGPGMTHEWIAAGIRRALHKAFRSCEHRNIYVITACSPVNPHFIGFFPRIAYI